MRRLLALSLVLALTLALAPLAVPAFAQGYPNRPLRIIVPTPAGGPVDVMARLLANALPATLGQPVIVENRPGAGNTLGSRQAADAPPDGYTLMVSAASGIIISPLIYKTAGYDAASFASVALIAETPQVLVVNPSLPAKTLAEFVALAKANAGKLNYSTGGVGTVPHLSAELFKTVTGTQILHVPYKGGGPSVASVVAGESQWTFTPAAAVMSLIRSNRLRALGQSLPKRTPLLGDLPAIAETIPGFSYSGWYGVTAPKNTPKPVIDKLVMTLHKVAATPEFRELITAQAAEVVVDTPDEFRKFVIDDIAQTGKAVRAAGLKAE